MDSTDCNQVIKFCIVGMHMMHLSIVGHNSHCAQILCNSLWESIL